ncbi:nuclease-related domain-containing protein [Sutcliffiella halmapala]
MVAEPGKQTAGFHGENALDYYLTFLPHENYQVFHRLRLKDHKSRYFQIETLLITISHWLSLESKNITGSLEFNEKTHQLTRETDNAKEPLGNPISQLERQKAQLEKLLEQIIGKTVPIIGQVVLTNKQATLVNITSSLM